MTQSRAASADAYETIARSEFSDHLREMVKQWKIILLASIVVGAALLYLGLRAPVLYEANATMLAVSSDEGDANDAESRAEQAAELATTRSALTRAVTRSGLNLDVDDVESWVTIGLSETPGFIVINVTAEDAREAVVLASAIAEQMEEEAPERNASILLVDPARSNGKAISGSPLAGAILASIATALLTAEALVAIRKLRGRLSPISPDADIQRTLGVPSISVGSTRRATDVDSLVPFFSRTLSDRPVVTVVQNGPVGDARIAGHLGVIAGRFHNRVLMVDADVNGATLHRHFAVERSPGLSEVLEGSAQLRETLKKVDANSSTALLSAGSSTPDGLNGSARIRATEQVVINAGADAAIVSVTAGSSLDDELVCVHQFPSAVVLVTDPHNLTLADLRRTADQIRSVGGRLVGVITAPAQGLDARE